MSTSETAKRAPKNDSRRVSVISIDKIERRFLTVLKREANRLMDMSYNQKLPDEDAKTLINYLKLTREFKNEEIDDLNNLTDTELEKLITNKEKK